jgi:hypothetical protein
MKSEPGPPMTFGVVPRLLWPAGHSPSCISCRSKASLEISVKIKATIEVEFEMDRARQKHS